MEQFTLKEDILYHVKEATDGSIQYTLVVLHSLKQKALSQAHEKSGHIGQKKTIKKAEELFYWCNLKVDVSNYVKQPSKKLKISYRRDVKKYSFPYRSLSTWNGLDEEIVCAKSIHEFKDKLDKKRYGDGTVRT